MFASKEVFGTLLQVLLIKNNEGLQLDAALYFLKGATSQQVRTGASWNQVSRSRDCIIGPVGQLILRVV